MATFFTVPEGAAEGQRLLKSLKLGRSFSIRQCYTMLAKSLKLIMFKDSSCFSNDSCQSRRRKTAKCMCVCLCVCVPDKWGNKLSFVVWKRCALFPYKRRSQCGLFILATLNLNLGFCLQTNHLCTFTLYRVKVAVERDTSPQHALTYLSVCILWNVVLQSNLQHVNTTSQHHNI